MRFIKPLPIKTRLAVQFTLLCIAILGTVNSVVYYLFWQNSSQDMENLVQVEYESIKNSIDILEYTDEGIAFRDQTLERIDRATNLGLLIFIFDKNGRTIVSPSSIDTDIPHTQTGAFSSIIAGQRYRLYSWSHEDLSIVIAANERTIDQSASHLRNILLVIWAIASMLSFWIGYLFSSRSIAPLKQLVEEVRHADVTTEDSVNISAAHLDDEIGLLAREFDELIERTRQTFRREKEFSQDISHELRTPIMVIQTSLELMHGHPLTSYEQEKIGMMQEAVEKMRELVDNLLFLDFLDHDIRHESANRHSLGGFLEKLTASFSPIAEQKGIRLSCEVREDCEVHTSTYLLERVFGNLIKNAIFYTQEWSVAVTLEKGVVTVEDTGVGMDSKELRNIWSRFYRIEKSRTQKQWGLGLGLAIAKKIIDAQRWNIQVESTPGIGTKFTVEIAE